MMRLRAADAYYRVAPYVFVKIIVEVPAALVSSLVFTAILYPSVGLRPGGPFFFFFVLATAVNIMISALVGCGLLHIPHTRRR
jgi:ABC-type multidrug transport system permease subunit